MDPRTFCNAVMHEYERQWAAGGGHAIRHPLRLKMDRLRQMCGTSDDADTFEQTLVAAESNDDDIGTCLLVAEILPLWQSTRGGAPPSFSSPASSPRS